METRLYNIFKSKNATKLARPILESSYKVLLETILSVTIRQPVHFLQRVGFLATFNLQINITLVIFWEKLQNNIPYSYLLKFLKKAGATSGDYWELGDDNFPRISWSHFQMVWEKETRIEYFINIMALCKWSCCHWVILPFGKKNSARFHFPLHSLSIISERWNCFRNDKDK